MGHSLEWLYILICLPMPVTCEYNHVLFSQYNSNEGLNSSQTLLYPGSLSVHQCAVLCTEHPCCLGYLYNWDNHQCILELRMSQRGDNLSPMVFLPNDDRQQRFRRGCAPSWIEYQGNCYYQGETRVSWTDAKVECEKRCSHLVEIGDKEKSDWLAATFLSKTWTGGNDVDVEGQYRWSYSNVTITFTAWYRNEPSVGYPARAKERDCIDLLRNGKWNDRSCSYLNPFICEMSYGQ
ncbi:collectin-12-like isoform X2 [Ostrea edulis]|uniref:collectin-12-like isoform X2 n=1 Tax=Ostrea edulis TaxID=37623 RepID=UPI0024AF9B5A|nr:collectin-12-like isoform X2 [Ostrea edulis]